MLALLRTIAVARLAAVLIAFALSGAPRLALARPASAGPARCSCPAHQSQRACPCGSCHKGGGAHAAHAGVERAHGSRGGSTEDRPSAPCMKGGCSMPEAPASAAPWATEVFTLSSALALFPPQGGAALPSASATTLHAPHLPETPPPRRA
ncbi:MAG: hypothetical protein ACJ79R_15650 [Anaeromyxobacteraceae bacterium]